MRGYLIDTHALVWYLGQSPKLSRRAFELISNPEEVVLVSVVSFWEMTIKASLGKLSLPDSVPGIMKQTQAAGIGLLSIQPTHLQALYSLPYLHRDPFDRMLVSQAVHEDFGIISRDMAIASYGVPLVW